MNCMNEFCKTRSSVIRLSENDDWKTMLAGYPYLLVVCTDSVRLMRTEAWTGDAALERRLLDLRAFSETGELHLCRAGDRLIGRIRTDGTPDGTETEYLDQKQLLWGRIPEEKERKPVPAGCDAQLHDDRGIDLFVPVKLSGDKDDRVFLTVRSYLADDTFTFTDYRICGLTQERAVSYSNE